MQVWGKNNMQDANALEPKVSPCRWCIPAFQSLYTSVEGIYILLKGGLTIRDVSVTRRFEAGELLFVRRGSYLVSTEEHRSELLWISLPDQFLQNFVQRFGALLSTVERKERSDSNIIVFANSPLLVDCVKSLRNLLVHEHPPMLASLKVEELLILFVFGSQGSELMSLLRQQTNRHVERLQLFMEQYFLMEWRLSQFAREFGVGLTTFKELFGVVYGVSPRAWISERRLLHAHHLLLNSELSIVDVAMASGFSSQSYFTHSYRRRFGCTPSRSRQGKELLLSAQA